MIRGTDRPAISDVSQTEQNLSGLGGDGGGGVHTGMKSDKLSDNTFNNLPQIYIHANTLWIVE